MQSDDSSAASPIAPTLSSAGDTFSTGERRPHLKLASAVMFVRHLDRSVAFYRELLGLEVTVQDREVALMVSPDGYQLYLRSTGEQAQHALGSVGIQYLVWTAENEEDLRRCERVLRAQSPRVTSQTVDGFTVVQGRGPDDVPVVVTYPGPEQAPRHQILQSIYAW
ncbi:MAG: VOC family protein [Nocardioidaceae bacterium]